MSTNRDLLGEALELPRADRAKLASNIIASLDSPLEAEEDVEAAWLAEIEQRMADFDAGKEKSIPWSEVRAQILARLRRR